MAVTAIRFNKPDGKIVRLKFMTIPDDGFIIVEAVMCDENFIPISDSNKGTHSSDEETYHRSLRKDAKEKGHFIPEESTNPEWNGDTVQSGLPE